MLNTSRLLLLLSVSLCGFLSAEETPDPKLLEAAKTFMLSRFKSAPTNQFFKPSHEELGLAIHPDATATPKEPLSFPKGNGVRLLMTGHSWVQPGVRTLPAIAKAGGFDGHHQRWHTSGGSTGFGKFNLAD